MPTRRKPARPSRSSVSSARGHPEDRRCARRRRQAGDRRASSTCSPRWLDNKTFPRSSPAWSTATRASSAAIAWALTSSRDYTPQLLLDVLEDPACPSRPIVSVIGGAARPPQRARTAEAAYSQEPNEKAALFRIIADIADAVAGPGTDRAAWRARTRSRGCTSSTSCRASTSPEVARALQAQLQGHRTR